MLSKIISLFILLFIVNSCAGPITASVDTDGDGLPDKTVIRVDDSAGPNQYYASIQEAVDAARPGMEIWVYKGHYEGFRVEKWRTSASKRLVVKAVEQDVVINDSEKGGSGNCIHINNSSHITIEGFRIERHGKGRFGIAARGAKAYFPMEGLIIKNNIVKESRSANIYLSQAADSIIENNITYGSKKSHGIYLANGGSDNTVIRGNVSYANRKNGIHCNGDLSRNSDGLQTGLIIENNTVFDNRLNGINLDGVQDVLIQNNLAYNNFNRELRAYRIDGAEGPKNYSVINNTFVAKDSWAIKVTADEGGHVFFNNIIVSDSASGGSICIGNRNFISRNNAVTNRFALDLDDEGNCIQIEFKNWQESGYGEGSFISRPQDLFVDVGSNFNLASSSRANNAGIMTIGKLKAPLYDIKSMTRAIKPDLGAFEKP